jgi:hypothetical protein
MRLDTIAKIEEFITNALLSSSLIPLGVNVVRLAATQDEEGIARMARSIVVRYTGSSASIEKKVPLVITRTMTFELSHASQSYLSESGHDYAVQMCSAAHLLLTNQVPVNTGAQIVTPLHLTSESFDGLTDSSHYVYTQIWQLEVQELSGLLALDPCVARGNCTFLFPDNTLGEKLPGDTVQGNEIWVPVLPPTPGLEYDPEFCGVEPRGDTLVYTHDKEQVFLEEYNKYTLVPTGTYDKTGQFLIVNIYNEDGLLVGTFFASKCGDRKLIQFGGNQGGSGGSGGGGGGSGGGNQNRNWVEGLWISESEKTGNMDNSNGPEPFKAIVQARNGFAYVDAIKATVFADPTDPNGATGQAKYGYLLKTLPDSKLVTADPFTGSETEFMLVGGTPLGKAWMRTSDLRILEKRGPEVVCRDEGDVAEPSGDECG